MAAPPLVLSDLAHWRTVDRARIKALLEDNVYGMAPQNLKLAQTRSRALAGAYFDGSATLVIETLQIQNPASGAARAFGLVIVRPAGAPENIPVIMMENFCPNRAVIPNPAVPRAKGDFRTCEGNGLASHFFDYVFGRYSTTPPIAQIMQHGFALASVFPSEFIPDSAVLGVQTLDRFFADQPPQRRTRAVMAWAAQYALLSHYLKSEKGFSRTIAYGHSRDGKAALVAAAFYSGIDGVVAHQSGTGGASLSRDKNGESIASVSEHYPHWFAPKFAKFAHNKAALPLDQHFLLALDAPAPVLLGNARRDVWSDPNGAFRAAEAASPVWALYGSAGLRQRTLTGYDAHADLAFWMRPGTHGVVKEDWPAFLEFLDAHFK